MLTRIISTIDFATMSEKEYDSLVQSTSYLCAIVVSILLFIAAIYYIRCWYKSRCEYYQQREKKRLQNEDRMTVAFLTLIDDKDREIEKLKKHIEELESDKEITDAILESVTVPETGLKGRVIHNGL